MPVVAKELKIIVVSISLLIVAATVLFLINQVYQAFILARSINDTFGYVVLATLAIFLGGVMAVPIILYFRLPQTLAPPGTPDLVPAYRLKLLKRLQSNSFLRANNKEPVGDKDLEASLSLLKDRADELIKKTALSVFLTTSVSQNGKLDAFTVLFTHTRLIWRICYLYNQRPGVKDLVRLYANVGATTFMASEIEDFDITLQVESLISGITKGKASPLSSIPFVGPAATLVLDSLFEGSTNAFLTLRVGIIARQYCSCTGTWEKRLVRRNATVEAAKMLNKVAADGTTRVLAGVVTAAKNAGIQTLKSGGSAVVRAGGKLKDGIAITAQKVNPFRKSASAKEKEDTQ